MEGDVICERISPSKLFWACCTDQSSLSASIKRANFLSIKMRNLCKVNILLMKLNVFLCFQSFIYLFLHLNIQIIKIIFKSQIFLIIFFLFIKKHIIFFSELFCNFLSKYTQYTNIHWGLGVEVPCFPNNKKHDLHLIAYVSSKFRVL